MNTCELSFLYDLHFFKYSEILAFNKHLIPHLYDLFMTYVQIDLNETLLLRSEPFIIILDAEIE
jgi:hypothetical protein